MASRLTTSILVLTLALAGCGQGGNPQEANQAADAFLQALVDGDADLAWSHLHPDTQERVYENDLAAFAREVNDADWSHLTWEFGPVVNFDYAWEVHFTVDEAAVPGFLMERRLALRSGRWLVMVVQTPAFQPYLVVAEEP